jgi:hypothetical protein
MKAASILFICFSILNAATAQTGVVPVFSSGNYYEVRAQLTEKSSGLPAVGVRAFVSVPGPWFQFNTATSDSSGTLTFVLKNMDRPAQLIFQTGAKADSSYLFHLAPDFVKPHPLPAGTDSFPVYDTTRFYGRPDKTYLLDAYTRFPTMEEVFREFVFEVRARKSGSEFQLSVLDVPFRTYFEENPLVLLDGIPVDDMNKVMALDPLKLQKIEVVGHKYYYGSMVFTGIISLFSYKGDLAGYTLPAGAMLKDFDGNIAK